MAKKRRNYREQADRWFSKIVRSEGACRRCGTTEWLQCAHIVPRRYNAVRTDSRNAMPLCRACHMHFTHRPLEWERFAVDQIGIGLFEELRTTALQGAELGHKVEWKTEAERLCQIWEAFDES